MLWIIALCADLMEVWVFLNTEDLDNEFSFQICYPRESDLKIRNKRREHDFFFFFVFILYEELTQFIYNLKHKNYLKLPKICILIFF